MSKFERGNFPPGTVTFPDLRKGPGREDAWRRFLEEQKPSLTAQTNRFVRDNEDSYHDAEDLYQRACERFVRRLAQDSPLQDNNPGGYLATIARNTAINDTDARAKRPEILLLGNAGGVPSNINVEGTALGSVRGTEIGKRLLAAGLNPRHVEVLLLRADGLDNTQIGEELGMPKNTVASSLHKARIAARTALAEVFDPVDVAGRKIPTSGGPNVGKRKSSTKAK